MKRFTIEDIRSWEPCYDPAEKVPETWSGTAIDILRLAHVSAQDRLWCVLRTELVSERTMRLFAVWCARQVQHLMTDARSIAALDVAERFANNQTTQSELGAAWAAADAAARDAVFTAACAAARAVVLGVARDAMWDDMWAAKAAAGVAARDAARATARAARDAARDAAGDSQINKLIEMIEAEECAGKGDAE